MGETRGPPMKSRRGKMPFELENRPQKRENYPFLPVLMSQIIKKFSNICVPFAKGGSLLFENSSALCSKATHFATLLALIYHNYQRHPVYKKSPKKIGRSNSRENIKKVEPSFRSINASISSIQRNTGLLLLSKRLAGWLLFLMFWLAIYVIQFTLLVSFLWTLRT